MYNTLLNMWINHKITQAGLDSAVTKGWITAEQEQTILATPQN